MSVCTRVCIIVCVCVCVFTQECVRLFIHLIHLSVSYIRLCVCWCVLLEIRSHAELRANLSFCRQSQLFPILCDSSSVNTFTACTLSSLTQVQSATEFNMISTEPCKQRSFWSIEYNSIPTLSSHNEQFHRTC